MHNELNDYFMKPTIMSNGLEVYPIKMQEYEKFKELANAYIVLDIPKRNNRLKQQWQKAKLENLIPKDSKFIPLSVDNLFKLFATMIEKTRATKRFKEEIDRESEENRNRFLNENIEIKSLYESSLVDDEDNIVSLIKMVLHKDVVFDKNSFDIYENGIFKGNINEENFYEFREIVMNSNLLFEPRVAPNLKSQEYIDKEIKKRFGDEETSLESLVAFVSVSLGGADISHYTYYRLRADYSAIKNKLDYIRNAIYQGSGMKLMGGGDISLPNFLSPFNLKHNIYQDLTKQAKVNDLDKQLMSR
ncbi:MAG: hypothetical protein ACRDD7_06200 [Peptostreptococcaceae bacterium]